MVELAEQLAGLGRPVMLETNGTLVPALNGSCPGLAYVSMDVKLRSVDGETVAAGHPAALPRRRRWAAGVTTWVKIVDRATTDPGEFDRAMRMVAETALQSDRGPGVSGTRAPSTADHRLEVFLQPVTPFGDVTAGPDPGPGTRLQERALRIYPRVRVVPQTHKAIGQL